MKRLVDAMFDAAQSADPKAEHSITLTPENSLLLPIHATELPRIVDGAYRGHVYRDCMVWDHPVLDHLVIVTPVVGRVTEDSNGPTYFGDLRNGTFGTEPPPIEE
ncbi:hypothetical protein [Microbacterium imperiale]|uniref:hypothetical protein n=1 Tax=Microbacterium imperiale TaxID=33884 RepID=UPI001AE265FA|nr:hypothetical protein [Microbacterium imperiale]MBP2420762.1 hypothetical protein [Microbacterium imperiale]MDS0200661.1 hypothetical protein [Microbacterium imperiale]BFE41102.1 hypothetical protein GCM10017544_20580 [Microbacterium imperiale]